MNFKFKAASILAKPSFIRTPAKQDLKSVFKK